MPSQAKPRDQSVARVDLQVLVRSVAVLFLLLVTSAGSRPHLAQTSQQTAASSFQTVASGIEHLKMTRGYKSENEASGPWVIHLLRVDPARVDLRIAHALDEGVGLETTSSIAARAGASAAVNAGFFRTSGTYRGEPNGVLAIDGKFMSEPLEGRAAFGFITRPGSTEIIFGHLKFSGYIESAHRSRHAIDGVNRPRGADELIVYTPEFHRTTLTTPDGLEIIVQRNRIIGIREGGSSVIPANGLVISARGRARDWARANLRSGSHVRVEIKLIPVESEMMEAWKRASSIVGGGPQLIRDARTAITTEAEGIAAKFASDRHPRTAIARLKDGRILLATVDGRQPGVSVGMTLAELASLLLEFGAVEGINLDGGGSTTMVINGKLMNAPSDQTGERPVSDALLIFTRALHSRPRMH